MSSPEFEPRRFRSTVSYYARYRLAYPEELIARVAAAAGLAPGAHVMDLGCGPGLLAIPFARAGMHVVGVDPEPEMLEAARAAAREAGVEVDFRSGSSYSLPDIGPLDLVTMGRSFHWMDRAQTLQALDARLAAGRAIALFEDDHPHSSENAWLVALREVGKRYGTQSAPHRAAAARSDHRSHISLLFDSAFSHVVRIGVFVRRAITADEIVGRAFSLSVLSHETLGERAEEFENDLRKALREISSDGAFVELAEIAAVVATRP